jgi:hypothetical protein
MARTAALLVKVAEVDSGEGGRCAVYSKYNNGLRTLPWSTPALTGKSYQYCFNLYKEMSAMQIRFLDKEIVLRKRQS